MRKLKNEKGITLIALVITVAVLSMISIPIVVNMTGMNEFDKYAGFKEDIDILREAISIAFYDKDIGTIGPKYEGNKDFLTGTQNGEKVKSANDNDVYYAIDVNKVNKNLYVNMEVLKNGEGNKNISSSATTYEGDDDVYIINAQSRVIYYVRGVSYNGKMYYRLNESFSETESSVVAGIAVTGFNKTYVDKYGNKAKIPVGYKLSENEDEQIVSKGLVISDDDGNEFVWVPVQNLTLEDGSSATIDFDRYDFNSEEQGGENTESESTQIKDGSNTDYFYETRNSFETASAIANGGFYIGRYRAGKADESSLNLDTVSEKKGISTYNNVTKEKAEELAENFDSEDEEVKSRLCSSYAWDTTLKFIETTNNEEYLTKNATGISTITTGASEVAVNNIYDLGYNMYEWTTEISSNEKNIYTIRGGVNSAESPITRKQHSNSGDSNIGFRVALFLKVY